MSPQDRANSEPRSIATRRRQEEGDAQSDKRELTLLFLKNVTKKIHKNIIFTSPLIFRSYLIMHLAFDAKRIFHNSTGLGNYSRTTVQNLKTLFPENKYFLITPDISDHNYALPFLEKDYIVIKSSIKGAGALWRTLGVSSDLIKHNVHIYHGLSNELPAGLQSKRIRSVVTIHDLLFLDFPADYKWADRKIYRLKFQRACEKANKVIAISHATKEKIVDYFKIPEDKISVIYQAVNPFYSAESPEVIKATVRRKWDIHYGFMLFVSANSPRKNIMGVLKSLSLLKDIPPLVVVGPGKFTEAREYAKKHKLSVVFTGRISNAELRALYQQCALLIYPSLGEGFGIPIVEAMMSKAPVITSHLSSMPEAGGDAAYYIDPYDPDSIASGIMDLLDHPEKRDEHIQKSFAQVKQFEASKCTEPLVKLYQSLI